MRRVVVTGLGVVAPNGVGKEAFWSACLNGRSGVGPIRTFDASGHPVRIAAEVPDFDVTPFVPPSQRKSLKIMGTGLVPVDLPEVAPALVAACDDNGRLDTHKLGRCGGSALFPLWILKYL